MSNKVKIAIDAMGGEKSPKKIIDGIKISLNTNIDNFFYLYGDENLLKKDRLYESCFISRWFWN